MSQIAKKAFTVIYNKKLSSSKDGYVCLLISNMVNLPINISKAVSSSSEASRSSIRKCSQIIQKIMSDVFRSVKSSNPLNAYKNASVIKCNKEVFMKSAEEAGIKIVTKVDIKDAAAHKPELP